MIRRWLAVGIILFFMGTCIIPAIAQNSEKPFLPSRGSWLYVGGSGPGNYTKIQDAIDNTTDGDSSKISRNPHSPRQHLTRLMTS